MTSVLPPGWEISAAFAGGKGPVPDEASFLQGGVVRWNKVAI